MTAEAKVGFFVPLVAKPDKAERVAQFLVDGYGLAQEEPQTVQWFGIRYSSPPDTFAIFDTFPGEAGRSAHLSGKVAGALLANAPDLLSPAPEISKVDILASIVKAGKAGDVRAGLTVGLRVLFTAKPDKVQAVREFLINAKPLVEAEPETPVWYAVSFQGTNQFGIIDAFAAESGRQYHLNGDVAKALFGFATDELLVGTPDLVKFDVLAAKI